jgi:hypothetical protein
MTYYDLTSAPWWRTCAAAVVTLLLFPLFLTGYVLHGVGTLILLRLGKVFALMSRWAGWTERSEIE